MAFTGIHPRSKFSIIGHEFSLIGGYFTRSITGTCPRRSLSQRNSIKRRSLVRWITCQLLRLVRMIGLPYLELINNVLRYVTSCSTRARSGTYAREILTGGIGSSRERAGRACWVYTIYPNFPIHLP